MIEHSNIIYMPTISALGGIETYVYELVKKYKDLDIAVVSKKCDPIQMERIKKYCNVYIHTNEKIVCDVAIINYDQSIIPFISDNAKIYQAIHADYTNENVYGGRYPKPNNRVFKFIGITKYLKDKMKNMLLPNEIMLSYNPLTIDDDKTIIIVSATRLHRHKGKDRMQCLIDKLDKAKVKYLWFVISNDTEGLKSDNVIYIKNRLDIDKFLSIADYVCLLSDSEACSYTLNEALYRNIPIITTPLPYLDEIGVKDGINAYIMDFDCKNVDSIVERITDIPKFNFERLEDKYDEIFTDIKSYYEEEQKMKVKVKCIQNFYDMEQEERKVKSLVEYYEEPEKHPNRVEWITTKARADHLVMKGLVQIVEYIDEVKVEDKKQPIKPEKKTNKKK